MATFRSGIPQNEIIAERHGGAAKQRIEDMRLAGCTAFIEAARHASARLTRMVREISSLCHCRGEFRDLVSSNSNRGQGDCGGMAMAFQVDRSEFNPDS